MMNCCICNEKLEKSIFTKKILDKYDVRYYLCSKCNTLQTEKPYWLNEAYSSAITTTDIGLINRNIQFSSYTEYIINNYFDASGLFLDFAGGYGMFTRLMRDKGFNIYHYDKYCENLFAKYFEHKDYYTKNYELITAFEVLEHESNPFDLLSKLFSITDSLFFSTEIMPKTNIEKWSYLSTETGQHVVFYSLDTLEYIAKKMGVNLITDNKYLHILSKKKLPMRLFAKMQKNRFMKQIIVNKNTLLYQDFGFVKKQLTNG